MDKESMISFRKSHVPSSMRNTLDQANKEMGGTGLDTRQSNAFNVEMQEERPQDELTKVSNRIS